MNYSEMVINSSRASHNASDTGTSTQTILLVTAARAILLATLTPAYTASMSISGASSMDLQTLLEVLHTSGYITSITTTTLTINW